MDIFKKIVCNARIAVIFITLVSFSSSDVDIKLVAKNLGEHIKEIKNDELGVPFILKLYDNFMHRPGNVDAMKNVKTMARKLETKISDVFSALDSAKAIVEKIALSDNVTNLSSVLLPCIQRDFIDYNSSLLDNVTTVENFDSAYVLETIKRNMSTMSNALKRYYFISNTHIRKLQNTPFFTCNGCDEAILWNTFMSRNEYQIRNVVMVLDIGSSLSSSQFRILKTIAKQMLSELNSQDRIALITITSNWTYLESDCGEIRGHFPLDSTPRLKEANDSYKQILRNYIDALIGDNGPTNHLLGIQKGLEIIANQSKLIKNETVMLLYVSRGMLSSLMEPKSVLETVAKFCDNYNISLVISTCAIVDDSRPTMYEPQFLRDIAEQNYTKYNISALPNKFRKHGHMLSLNNTKTVPFAVNYFYSIFNPMCSFNVEEKISLPNWETNNDLTLSFTKGLLFNNTFFMLGADVYFSSLAEDVAYYSANQDYSYTFLMDLKGRVLIHPSFLRPSIVTHQVSFVNIEHIEKISDIDILKKRLITEEEGIHEAYKNNNADLVKYVWSRVGEWSVICIVVNTKYGPPSRPYKSFRHLSSSDSKFLYQNMEDYKMCRHLNLLATIDVTSLYLSTPCFQSPFIASRTTPEKLIVYLAYLKDNTRLLANPGLKEEVRDEVLALTHVLDFLRKRHLSSVMSKYVVRRYASSYTGVLQMFPGSVLKPGLKPTKRPWFLRSLQHKGKVVFVPPYLDKGGAGYIVTIAYATSQLVVAIDVTYGYMLKLLLKHMPDCLNTKVTCFLIDDQGYIIYHPNLMDINGARPIEQQHIVHKESLVSNDILNHKHFIQKLLCNNYGDNTIQRYYRLNTSFIDVLVNFVPGEHCVTYRITTVPNTNIFVGIVNASCDFVATFCPCSIVDRLCLNCNRMEQKECECPCECPLEEEYDICETKSANKNMTDNLPCTWNIHESSLETSFVIDTESHLEPCFPINCQVQKTHMDCLGLIGCEWCRYDMDRNFLRKPFCASINTCFNGVFDVTTSYAGDMSTDSEYSPVGPILGSVIAMCILFVLLFICYRSYTNPSTERLYLSSTQDQLRMSDLNVNDTFHDSGNHRDKLLQEERSNVISPYCVASTYRRTTVPADSDHGYSTMTPHDESEHLSLAPVEVDSLEDDVMSDSTSIHTSISTKESSPHVMSPMFTKIPNRNCIIVPVTVHRNMEKT